VRPFCFGVSVNKERKQPPSTDTGGNRSTGVTGKGFCEGILEKEYEYDKTAV